MPNISPMQVVRPVVFSSFENTRASDATFFASNKMMMLAGPDTKRYTYNQYTGAPEGWISEAAATNLIPYSDDFSAGSWSLGGGFAYMSGSSPANPDGTTSVDGLTATGSGTCTNSSLSLTGTHTFSVYLNHQSGNPIVYMFGFGGAVAFDISAPALDLEHGYPVAVGANGRIQKCDNGWYRCSITGTPDASFGFQVTLDAGSFWVWGLQIEAGLGATSFIYTEATAATRAADVVGSPPYLISSNIVEDDYGEYNPATAYPLGQMVMVTGSTHKNFKANVGSTGQSPPSNPTYWTDAGATERWRMFDMTTGSDLQSINEGSIDVSVALAEPVSSVTLLNVYGTQAIVRMFSSTNELLDERIVPLISDPPEATWYDYFFGRRTAIKNITLTDFPDDLDTSIQVLITGEDETDTVKLGKLVIGDAITLGYTEYGSSVGIIDYSTKEPDGFGNFKIVERRYVGKADLKVVVNPFNEGFVLNTLAEVRAQFCLYIGHKDYEATIIYGFPSDFNILFSTPADSFLSITLTGV